MLRIAKYSPIQSEFYPTPNLVYYRTTGGLHYRVFTMFSTFSRKESAVSLRDVESRNIAFCAYASNLWNLFYYTFSNCLDVARFELNAFPLGLNDMAHAIRKRLVLLATQLDDDLRRNACYKIRHYENIGDINCYTIEMRQSKPIIDEIDKVLAQHYGFTDEELDFIINYDIKYRMGNVDDENGEDE
jgi:hypothetical protein